MRHLQMQPGRKGGLSAGQCQARVSLLSLLHNSALNLLRKSHKWQKLRLGFDCEEKCFFSPQRPLPPHFYVSTSPPFSCRQGRTWVDSPFDSLICITCFSICCFEFWYRRWWSCMFKLCLSWRFAGGQSIEREAALSEIWKANKLWTNLPAHFDNIIFNRPNCNPPYLKVISFRQRMSWRYWRNSWRNWKSKPNTQQVQLLPTNLRYCIFALPDIRLWSLWPGLIQKKLILLYKFIPR